MDYKTNTNFLCFNSLIKKYCPIQVSLNEKQIKKKKEKEEDTIIKVTDLNYSGVDRNACLKFLKNITKFIKEYTIKISTEIFDDKMKIATIKLFNYFFTVKNEKINWLSNQKIVDPSYEGSKEVVIDTKNLRTLAHKLIKKANKKMENLQKKNLKFSYFSILSTVGTTLYTLFNTVTIFFFTKNYHFYNYKKDG